MHHLFPGAILADAAQNVGTCIDVGTGRLSGRAEMGGSDVGLAVGVGMHPSVGVCRYGTGQGFHTGAGDVQVVCLAAGAGDVQWTHWCRSWKPCGLSRWVRVGWQRMRHCCDIGCDTRAAGGGAGMCVRAGACILAADMWLYVCDCIHSCRCEYGASDRHVGRRSDRPSERGGECHSYQNLEYPCSGHQL